MREWINNRFGTDFTENDLLSIKNFSLIWNVFENDVCHNNCSVARLTERLHPIQFEVDEFAGCLEYFKDRYVTDGATNGRFEHLNFRNNDRRELVEEVLLGNNNEISSIVLALSIIVYRFRNNLFHGLKEIQFIDQQQTNFENAILILKAILRH
ncbi:MAG: hypothetical protein GX660_27335, partial [Clostridiaceae bacterium]|nr:hypothetical protein [Clostridiaceae bacterium]